MNHLEFIIQLLDIAIWPFTILVVFLLLRKQIIHLAPFIKKIKISELELEMDSELAKIHKEAVDEFDQTAIDWRVNLMNIANSSPSAAILEAWKTIESKSEKLILKSNPQMDLDTPTRYKLMQTTLIDQELIESKKAKIFDDLRQLRNRVAHAEGFAVSKEQALSYISVAIALAEYLDEKLR
ncbi:MAG: hypothetical protein CMB80_25635 [Flammeovirgaceae bacterium]|nr:hypothetical protein [Flammeovirgaceae bacterium]MBE62745.1 hypothetical protein [Flammeovirgaceae bacterium]HCX22602.1 hypothetical protein [Cytophagales bacterium]